MSIKPREPESEEPRNIHIEDTLVHIQRHKGTRARYELYVHNAQLRSWLQVCEILVPSEKDKPMKHLKKKMLFYSVDFGNFLRAICDFLNRAMQADSLDEIAPFMLALEKRKLELLNSSAAEESPWDEIYNKLTKMVKSKEII